MSKYIISYDEMLKLLGITDLKYIKTIEIVPDLIFQKEFIYGSRILVEYDNNNPGIYMYYTAAKNVSYYKHTDNPADINFENSNEKFLMNKKGEIYTIQTGLIGLNYYHLDEFQGYSLNQLVKLKNNDLLRGDIRILFLIKKKHYLPKFIYYMILLEISKLHLIIENNTCGKCTRNIFKNRCHVCNVCYKCGKMYKKIVICPETATKVCRNCYPQISC